jgi:prepilin-type N-terminal cleavage/methylation domain-containing protein
MSENKGFTLIEVLVALVFFSIAMVGFQKSFIGIMKYNLNAEKETEAAAAAQTVLDELRTEDVKLMPSSGTASPEEIKVGKRFYEVVVKYCSDPSFCVGDNNRHLLVKVVHEGKEIYEVATVFTKLN